MLDISKKVLRVEFVEGKAKKAAKDGNFYPYRRIDVYLPTLDQGEKKFSMFVKYASDARLCGLSDPDYAPEK